MDPCPLQSPKNKDQAFEIKINTQSFKTTQQPAWVKTVKTFFLFFYFWIFFLKIKEQSEDNKQQLSSNKRDVAAE